MNFLKWIQVVLLKVEENTEIAKYFYCTTNGEIVLFDPANQSLICSSNIF